MRPEYGPGARNAVRTCLNIGEADRVIVVKDQERRAIAEAIEEEVVSTGADLRSGTLEEVLTRPARELPASMAEEIRRFRPTASYYIGGSLPGELAFRQPLLKLLTQELRCRHGHMVGIEHRLMLEGMAAD